MKRRGQLVVISGFSGAGKGTIVKKLLTEYDQYALSVSMTTRKPRPGEVDGREYFFVSTEEFEKAIVEGKMLEYAGYVDHYYGTPRAYVEQKMEEGKDVILEIEVQGARQIKQLFPEAVLLFVTTPSAQILRDRLTGRGTEDEETIRQRLLQAATREVPLMADYDYLIVNDVLEDAVTTVHQVIEAARLAPTRNVVFIKEFADGLHGASGAEGFEDGIL